MDSLRAKFKQKTKKILNRSSNITKQNPPGEAVEPVPAANAPSTSKSQATEPSHVINSLPTRQKAAKSVPTSDSSLPVSPNKSQIIEPTPAPSTGIPSGLQGDAGPFPTVGNNPTNSKQKPPSCWKEAFDKLSDEQRRNLRISDPTSSIEEELAKVQEAKKTCVNGRRTITMPNGKIIVIRDKLQGVLKKMQQYVLIGDIAIQHHPDIVALVWAGVRFCMQVVLDDMETFDQVISFLEEIANIVGSCRIYENFFSPSDLESTRRAMHKLLLLYVAILEFIAEANIYFSAPSGERMTKATTNPFVLRFQPKINKISGMRKDLDESARIAHMDVHKRRTQEQLQAFQELNNQLSLYQTNVVQIQDDIGKLLLHVEAEKRAKILQWLSPVLVGDHHEGLKKLRFGGTGEWLFIKPAYENWIESDSSSTLWLCGKAGSGKSVLSSFITDTLKGTQKESVPVVFFYCNYKEGTRKEASSILRSLLKQLSAQLPDLHQDLVVAYDKANAEGHNQTSLNSHITKTLIRAIISRFKTIFIVVDALDECDPEERKTLVRFLLDEVEASDGCLVKMFLTSRDENDLRRMLEGKHSYIINSDDTGKDIRPFVEHEVANSVKSGDILDGDVSVELQTELITSLVGNADGMFLWVKYQLLQLADAANEHDLKNRLKISPQGLEAMYREIWEKIGLLDNVQKKLAYRTISWILYATEPLSPECLVEATAIEPSDAATFDGSRKASNIGYLIRACKHLVVQDIRGGVRFMHYSVQEFVRNQPEVHELESLAIEVCLIALSHLPEDNSKHNLYDHAVRNWELYLRDQDDPKVFESTMDGFLFNEVARQRWIQRRYYPDYHSKSLADAQTILSKTFHILNPTAIAVSLGLPKLFKHLLEIQPEILKVAGFDTYQLLYLAVRVRNAQMVKLVINSGVDVNAQGGEYGDALQAAASSWNMDAVKILLEAGADVNAQGGEYGNALQAAVSRGNMDAVKILLEAGADVNAQGGKYGNALQAVAWSGNMDAVKILLGAGADVNAQGGPYGNALQAAASSWNMDAVKILLKAGADVNAQGGEYGSALQAAVSRGNMNVVKILLKAGADANTRRGLYGDALQTAASRGDMDAVKILLEAGADVNAQGGEYGNALQAAASRGNIDAVKTLLEAGADVNAQGRKYGNALQAAVSRGNMDAVKTLLEAGADVNAQGRKYGNALQAAAFSRNMDAVKILLEAGADANAQGGEHGNALQAAAFDGNIDAVKILLEAGADVNAQEGEYGNALQAAAFDGNIDAVKILLEAGADVNAQGGKYGNALQAAAERGNIDAVKTLLEAGADVNAQGRKYGNALQAAVFDGNMDAVKILLEAGADVNARGGTYGNALQAAASRGNTDAVKILLEAGADVNAQEGVYGNALQAAASSWNMDAMEILLEAGADANTQRGEYGNALQAAVSHGNMNAVEILLEAGADVNAQGGFYGSALQAATSHGNLDVVKILLEAGADVNAQGGKYGNTLQAAASLGGMDVVKMLLEAGADVNAQGGEYGNALQAAAERGDMDAVKILLEAGADVNTQGGKYGNALQAAASSWGMNAVEILLGAGADVNAQGGEYGNALQAATSRGNTDAVKILLKAGAKPMDTTVMTPNRERLRVYLSRRLNPGLSI